MLPKTAISNQNASLVISGLLMTFRSILWWWWWHAFLKRKWKNLVIVLLYLYLKDEQRGTNVWKSALPFLYLLILHQIVYTIKVWHGGMCQYTKISSPLTVKYRYHNQHNTSSFSGDENRKLKFNYIPNIQMRDARQTRPFYFQVEAYKRVGCARLFLF